ncbi:MAG TPA: O-antigen polysaccharide polymerase Wzy [Tepidisphaeraceae bacterium]|jgi:hypothetical protein|nr:O-antigen polysaccharide polymerase Wzy [Tepidisphaeraceae bacterium]
MSVAAVPLQWELASEPAESLTRRRSRYSWAPFVAPLALTGVSWLMGGMPILTDAGFLALTVICVIYVIREMALFPQRFGIGGLILFGGTVIWFCYDYMTNWLGVKFSGNLPILSGTYKWGDAPYSAEILAKASFFHSLFLLFATMGLLIKRGKWPTRVLTAVSEPKNRWVYLLLLLFFCLLGITPYLFFTVDPWYEALYKHIRGGYGMGIGWTLTRGATINTSSLMATVQVQLLELGYVAGAFAAFYAIMIARSAPGKILGWGLWVFWMLMAVGTGARSNTLTVAMPAVALLFLKFNASAAALFRRISVKAYATALVVGLLTIVVVQYQGFFRTTRFEERDISQLSVTTLSGNTMFSEGLIGYYLVPEYKNFLYDTFPGAGIIRPIPQTIFDFAVGFVPRPLWPGKPVNEIAMWYSRAVTGEKQDLEEKGITGISRGLVGHWYFPYGWAGVIEGGLLFGWLLGIGERALLKNLHRPLTVLLVLGYLTFLFRSFRDVTFSWAYPVIFTGIILWVMVKVENALFGGGPAMDQDDAAGEVEPQHAAAWRE